jgi:hypothetical protein
MSTENKYCEDCGHDCPDMCQDSACECKCCN